jgi:hypothetical protein
MAKTVDDLIESVKTTITLPTNQALITTDRLLGFANEEIQNELYPTVSSINQEFLVYVEEAALVSGQDLYQIPYRAAGRALRDLKLRETSGDNSKLRNIPQITLERSDGYADYQGNVAGFHFQNDKVRIVPMPNSTGYSLVFYYFLRPSALVPVADCGRVTGISSSVVTLDNVPSEFVSGAVLDYVSGKSGCVVKQMDQTISNVSGLNITMAEEPDDLAIGDYLSLAETTPVIPFPDECFSYLVLLTSQRILEAIGDFDGSKALDKRVLQIKRNMLMILAPRIEGETIPIIHRNGLLNRGRYLRGYRWNNS